MRILITNEKYGTSVFDVTTEEQLKKVSTHLVEQRLNAGWYLDKDAEQASFAVMKDKAYYFLTSRKDYEYEDFELIEPIDPDEL